MMPASLRSRLWWSYALVIASALAMVAFIFLIYIVQNPATYREANARLTLVAAVLRKNDARLTALPKAEIQSLIEQTDSAYNTRIVLYSSTRKVIADSEGDQQPELQIPRFPRLRSYSILRDVNGEYWLYLLRHLEDGRWLLLAVPRPAVPFLAIFSDELMLPIGIGGAVALVVSLLAATGLSRWIGNPLQELVSASHKMPSDNMPPISLRGPAEVQALARAFNQMHARVHGARKSQRDFVANVSHELKTPLTSIQGFAQAIMDGTADTPETRQQAGRVIYEESGRMHHMVIDLLDLARLDAGTLDLQFAPVDMDALLNSVAENFALLADQAGVSIRVDASNLPSIPGDGDRLRQVFTNMVDNAMKFTPSGGSILLSAHREDSSIVVEVRDTGKGIPVDAFPYIFDRFFRVDPSRQGGDRHGSGLGLAIAREIVEAHGGTISVRSPTGDRGKQGVGSVFVVTLPVSKPNPPPQPARKK